MVVTFFILFLLAVLTIGEVTYHGDIESVTEDSVEDYLKHYGYWPMVQNSRFSRTEEDEQLLNKREALKSFQEFLGLEPTGRLDSETKAKIAHPRCGVPDVNSNPLAMTQGYKWTKSSLTYSIKNYTNDVTKQTLRAVIKKAFEMWSEVIPLEFTEVPETDANVDIRIVFAKGEHGDMYNFDNKGGILAHASFPPLGEIHFDDDEDWVYMDAGKIENETHIDLLNTAVHEIGHALGLSHIGKVESAIMAPYYKPTIDSDGNYMPPHLTLHDISAVRKIYKPRRSILTGNSNKTTPETANSAVSQTDETTTTKGPALTENECPDHFTAVVADKDTIFVFSRSINIYKIQNQQVVQHGEEDTFLTPWDYTTVVIGGYVRNGHLVLFNSQKMVYIFDPISGSNGKFKLRDGYPKKTPINKDINGAIIIDDKAYIFSFSDYLIYDEHFNNATETKRIRNDFPNFPKLIKGGYSQIENSETILTVFARDATMKKSQISRYDLRRKVRIGEPKDLLSHLKNCQ